MTAEVCLGPRKEHISHSSVGTFDRQTHKTLQRADGKNVEEIEPVTLPGFFLSLHVTSLCMAGSLRLFVQCMFSSCLLLPDSIRSDSLELGGVLAKGNIHRIDLLLVLL